MLVYTVAVERLPWSAPAKDPVTLADPPVFGTVNPTSPDLLYTKASPENEAVVEWIELGFHVPVLFGSSVVSRARQLFEGRCTTTVRVPLATRLTFEPFVTQPVARNFTT